MRNSCLLLIAIASQAGCAVAPPPARLLAAADPHARPSPLHRLDASAGMLTFRPAGPRGWGEEEPVPKPKAKGTAQ